MNRDFNIAVTIYFKRPLGDLQFYTLYYKTLDKALDLMSEDLLYSEKDYEVLIDDTGHRLIIEIDNVGLVDIFDREYQYE